MWQGSTLTLLLVASMTRSGSNGSTSCPENCQCTIVTVKQSEDQIDNLNNNKSIEVHCERAIPRIDTLPENIQRLVVKETKPYETMIMLLELENSENIVPRELAIINCSLTNLNITLGSISNDIAVTTSLNISSNDFAETRQLQIHNADRLAVLDLSQNRLTSVRKYAFVNYVNLLKLNLRQNVIAHVEEAGFAGLDLLEGLDLSDNRLDSLGDNTFLPLCRLKKLNLSGNRLGVFGEQWFDNLEHLRVLDLSRNVKTETSIRRNEDIELSLVLGRVRRLEIVDASHIGLERVPSSLTRSVRILNLAGNELTTICGGDFDGYPLLRVLDLSYNVIVVVEDDALGRLEILEKLDLTGNRLSQLPLSLPSALRRLVASENIIDKLSRRDLEGLTRLESLSLNDNVIDEIEVGTMTKLFSLNELDLSKNPLKQLPANTFDGTDNLAVLRMSGLSLLQWEREKSADMAFPVPAPERLVNLDLSASPALAAQLFADEAALSACKSLRELNIARTNLTELRSDLPYLLPQLRVLGLSENRWNCTCAVSRERIVWLAKWIGEHEEIEPRAKCYFYNRSILLADLRTERATTNLPIIATELNGASSDNDSRVTLEQQKITIFRSITKHPVTIVLVGAIFGALAVALGLIISRRRAFFGDLRIDDLERYDQRRPIVTELW